MLTGFLALILGGTLGPAAGPGAVPTGSAAAPCPTPADIETAIGFPVKAHPMPADHCMYELTGEYQGAFVTLSYQPATRADDRFAAIRQHVKVKGVDAKPDRVTLGEGGWGYGSRGKQEAAVVSQGRLYHVDVEYDLFDSMTLREDAATRVIEVAMRGSPGGTRAP